jgi:hypothetical protein
MLAYKCVGWWLNEALNSQLLHAAAFRNFLRVTGTKMLLRCILLLRQQSERYISHTSPRRSVAQSGSASGLGPEGREFESLHSDHRRFKTGFIAGWRSVAQSGSASGLGPEGREFESLHSDHF